MVRPGPVCPALLLALGVDFLETVVGSGSSAIRVGSWVIVSLNQVAQRRLYKVCKHTFT